MKTALTLATLLAGTTLAADGLRTDYAQERALRVSRTLHTTSELVDFSMTVDGEERDGMGGDRSSESTRQVVTVLRVEAHEEGRPTKVLRSYEELAVRGNSTFGENSRDFDRTSPSQGAVLGVSLGEDGEVEVEILDGEVSDALLEAQALDLELDAFLPGEDVEDGDSWDLEPEAIARGLMIGQERVLFPREEREPAEGGEGRGGRRGRGGRGGGGALNDQALATLEWEGEAKLLEETRDHDGLTCRVIQLELEASGELPERERGERGRDRALGLAAPGALRGTTLELELEGELLVCPDEGRPVLLVLEGDYALEMQRSMERGERTMEMSSTTEGELKFEVEVSLED